MEISWLGQPSALFLLMLVILMCPIRAKSLPVMPAGKHGAALPATDEANREMAGLLSFLLHRIIKSAFKEKKTTVVSLCVLPVKSPQEQSRESAGGKSSSCSWLYFGLVFSYIWDNTFLEAWGRIESPTYKIPWKLRCFKNNNRFSNLQMTKKNR